MRLQFLFHSTKSGQYLNLKNTNAIEWITKEVEEVTGQEEACNYVTGALLMSYRIFRTTFHVFQVTIVTKLEEEFGP